MFTSSFSRIVLFRRKYTCVASLKSGFFIGFALSFSPRVKNFALKMTNDFSQQVTYAGVSTRALQRLDGWHLSLPNGESIAVQKPRPNQPQRPPRRSDGLKVCRWRQEIPKVNLRSRAEKQTVWREDAAAAASKSQNHTADRISREYHPTILLVALYSRLGCPAC